MKRIALALFAVMFFAQLSADAYANSVTATGTTTCIDGQHAISWSITNGDKRLPMTVDAEADLPPSMTFHVGVLTNPVPARGVTEAVSFVPGDVVGTVTLNMTGTWPNGIHKPATAAVVLEASCPTTTTTTPTTEPVTTTSMPTSTTSMPASTTSMSATTAPKPSPCGGPLPCTGVDSVAPTLIGLGLLLFGGGMFWWYRLHRYY